jgi:membrane protease YdiL (CAAX protease family)
MKKQLHAAYRFLGTTPLWVYLPIAYIAILFLRMLVSLPFPEATEANSQLSVSDLGLLDNIWFQCIAVVVLAPLLETALFNTLPYYFLNLFAFMRKHFWLILVLPSLLFGAIHVYSPFYSLQMFATGMVFMSTYALRFPKGDSFVATLLLHAINNLISIILINTNG